MSNLSTRLMLKPAQLRLLAAIGDHRQLQLAAEACAITQPAASRMLAGIERGLSNRDIGSELGIAEHTVKVHLNRLFRLLGVRSRTQALREVRLRGVHLTLQGLSDQG